MYLPSQENWALASCDKTTDGLLTRLSNQRLKFLEKHDVCSAQPLADMEKQLQALADFGAEHKKGYMKHPQKPSTLASLVVPLQNLRAVCGQRESQWHHSLKGVAALVEVQALLDEKRVACALALLDPARLSKIVYDPDSLPQRIYDRAVALYVERVENLILDKLSKVLVTRKILPITERLVRGAVGCGEECAGGCKRPRVRGPRASEPLTAAGAHCL